MNCDKAHDYLLDLAQAENLPQANVAQKVSSEVLEHVRACQACTAGLESLLGTMELMEEWQAPEVSPYFDSKLRARVREVAEERRVGWLDWLRKPAIGALMAGLIILGVSLLRNAPSHSARSGGDTVVLQPQRGTAVGDLRDLDQNLDLYANFDALDDLGNSQPPQNQ